jgi:hypothetical protein
MAGEYFDPATDHELTPAVIHAIAEADGSDLAAVSSTSLYDCVDLSALQQALFGPGVGDDCARETVRVEFQYDEYLVEIRGDGWIGIYESREK